MLKEEAIKLYETKEAEFPEPEQIREIERVVLLKGTLTTSGWPILTIWMHCVRESAFRLMPRGILWLSIR